MGSILSKCQDAPPITQAEAIQLLSSEFGTPICYGWEGASESPCSRVQYDNKTKRAKRALRLAFIAYNGRDVYDGYVASHRCHCTNTLARHVNSSGICINGEHICEQLSGENRHRTSHQNLIRFWIKTEQHKGLRWGPYYLRDVPEDIIIKYVRDVLKQSYKGRPVCACKHGLCFVNCKRTDQQPRPRTRKHFKYR